MANGKDPNQIGGMQPLWGTFPNPQPPKVPGVITNPGGMPGGGAPKGGIGLPYPGTPMPIHPGAPQPPQPLPRPGVIKPPTGVGVIYPGGGLTQSIAPQPTPAARPPVQPMPAPVQRPNYDLYRQRFDPNVARDFQQFRQNTAGMGNQERALKLHGHMKNAMQQGRFSKSAEKAYQGLVDAVNRGEVDYGEAMRQVNDYIAKHATPGAGGPERVEQKIGRKGPGKASARLFNKGGAVDKKAAQPKKAAAKKAPAKKAAPKKAAAKPIGRKAPPKFAKKSTAPNRVSGRGNQGNLRKLTAKKAAPKRAAPQRVAPKRAAPQRTPTRARVTRKKMGRK